MRDDKSPYLSEKIDELSQDIKEIKQTQIEHAIQFARHEESDKRMGDDIHAIRQTLEKNTQSLEEHMRRTAAAESQISILKDISLKMDHRLHPIEDDKRSREASTKLLKKLGAYIGAISAIITAAYTIWDLIKHS